MKKFPKLKVNKMKKKHLENIRDINKITQINIYISNKVLHHKFDKSMADDLKKIEEMFEKDDFSELDEIYKKYFIPKQ